MIQLRNPLKLLIETVSVTSVTDMQLGTHVSEDCQPRSLLSWQIFSSLCFVSFL